jgi:hypothetical protein
MCGGLRTDAPRAQVDDVVDANMVRQGQAGYSNEQIMAGDLILSVDGRDVQNVSVAELHSMLRGTAAPAQPEMGNAPPGSAVNLPNRKCAHIARASVRFLAVWSKACSAKKGAR